MRRRCLRREGCRVVPETSVQLQVQPGAEGLCRGRPLARREPCRAASPAASERRGFQRVGGGGYWCSQSKGLLIGAAFNPLVFAEVMQLWQ